MQMSIALFTPVILFLSRNSFDPKIHTKKANYIIAYLKFQGGSCEWDLSERIL